MVAQTAKLVVILGGTGFISQVYAASTRAVFHNGRLSVVAGPQCLFV